MSHEQSITFRSRRGRHRGQVVNTPGVHGGQRISAAQADELLEKGTLKPLGDQTYSTIQEGVDAAKKRSGDMGREINRMRRKKP